jgi:cytoskeletal protein CcmA (bactofilin family)
VIEFIMFFKPKKKSREVQQVNAEPSYIARDTSLEGNIICDGEIHIDGAVRGSVRAQTCLVDAHGEVHGEVSAEIVFVRGRVIGPVSGTHVQIYSGAHVEGNVTNETISIENGAYVFGSIRHGGAAQQPALVPQSLVKDTVLNLMPGLSVDDKSNNVRPIKTNKPRS